VAEALHDARAVTFESFGVVIRVAALRDIIAGKEAVNRTKERAVLSHLYALEDEIAASGREPDGPR
jgi:hypothetical protein